jgi:predicted transcriptional regulator of viral defense system
VTYLDFLKAFESYPAISINEMGKAFPQFDRKVLVDWQKKGYLLKIRNGWYAFTIKERQTKDLFWIANRLYVPSYVSLQSALSFHGLIPEGVFSITSVSTLKTASFESAAGNFTYRNIKSTMMFGYELLEHGNFRIKMAGPEKALLDYLYLNPSFQSDADMDSLRLNAAFMKQTFDWGKARKYIEAIGSNALHSRFQIIIENSHAAYQ